MMRSLGLIARFAVVALMLTVGVATAADMHNIFFLHHSTGRYLINEGNMRGALDAFNQANGTDLEFWDHDYNAIGLREEDGGYTGYDYQVPGDNTDPDGLFHMWTTANVCRDSMLNHDVIAFKSCYPASNIASDAELATRKQWYLQMRNVFDQHPDKIFVVMSQPPLHRLATDVVRADRARAFASWLVSAEYLAGHDNVIGFDFFDYLAKADDGSSTRNMLRYEYERSHSSSDSHPNVAANVAVGPILMEFLANAATAQTTVAVGDVLTPVPTPQLLPNYPNPFNPSTTVVFDLPQPGPVSLAVFDQRGSLVWQLVDGEQPAGTHEVVWNGRQTGGAPLASGVYMLKLSAGAADISRPITLVK